MQYSEETLYVLACSLCSKNDEFGKERNIVSGHAGLSCADFFELKRGQSFREFRVRCEERLSTDVVDFDAFKRDVAYVLDGECFDDERDLVLDDVSIKGLVSLRDSVDGIISPFDPEFPPINAKVRKGSDKPYLLFYKGDISLLGCINENVAVVGLLDPAEAVGQREKKIVEALVENQMNIVSGLAKGCDTIAHEVCLKAGGRTVAVLPSPISSIYPAENRALAHRIVEEGGLLVTEYFLPPRNKFEARKRFVDRDRLQAMFSKAVVLAASYREGEGDSGSRHALKKGEEWGLRTTALFNGESDNGDPQFGLNKDLIASGVAPASERVLRDIVTYRVEMEPSVPQLFLTI